MKSIRKASASGAVCEHSSSQSPRKPWPLIALGVVGFAVMLIVGFDPAKRRAPAASPTGHKVYSAAADIFEPMALTSRESGELDPPGVVSPLRLFAVKVGSNSRQGLAVLGASEASSRTYVGGASLENGAQLTDIYTDHVVLTRGGKKYTLYLPQHGRDNAIATDAPGLTIGDVPAPQPPVSPPRVRVSDAVRVAPVYEGTQIAGFAVYAGSLSAQFARWGLKEGDVLLSIGGQSLIDSEQMESLLEQLEQGATLKGEVRRGEGRVPVTLDGSALVAVAAPANTTPPIH